ncbi:MAG TPA: VWA domain-containing protein [Gemmatimonadaceae bacterium]|nr:VWA domain-containing protein [Gemmatimonadaceae bacterium]
MIPLNVRTDRSLIRAAARSRRYVTVRFVAPEAPPRAGRAPVNVAIVLDRSGSMGGEKFVLARQAAERALAMLRPEDRFALVVYDTEIDVLAPSTPAVPEAKRHALSALASIGPRGGTDLGGGWLRGCEQVALHASGELVNRCLLLTDGQANHGITDPGELARHAAALRERGVRTSTFGVGSDFDERLLGGMSDAGGGNSYFLDHPARIPEMITSELGEALEVVMRDAALEVTLPAGARAEPLQRFRWRHIEGDNELRVELGDLVSAQEMAVTIAIELPRGEAGETAAAGFALSDRDHATAGGPVELRWTWAGHPQNDRQPRDRTVDREVATLYAARARAEATERNRHGDYEGARRVLRRTADRILSYAGNDPELHRIASELLAETETFAAPMPAMAMKAAYYSADAVMRERAPSGRAKRGDGSPPSRT